MSIGIIYIKIDLIDKKYTFVSSRNNEKSDNSNFGFNRASLNIKY